MDRFWILVLAFAAGGCRPSKTSGPAHEPSSWPAAPGTKAAPCSDAADCYAKGRDLVAHGDAEGRERLSQACALGSKKACAELGIAYARGLAGNVDDGLAREKLHWACVVDRDRDACAWLLRVLVRSADPRGAPSDASRIACSAVDVAPENRDVRGEACVSAAEASLRAGRRSEALVRMEDGCALGHRPACDRVEDVRAEWSSKPAENGADVLSIPSITTDGVLLTDVSCKMPRGSGIAGLLGGVTVGVALKARKRALDACASRGARATRIAWLAENGHMADVTADSADEGERRCIVRALAGAVTFATGQCAATIHHGTP
jgi:hypothetical protein